jgi:hypothetical protein
MGDAIADEIMEAEYEDLAFKERRVISRFI